MNIDVHALCVRFDIKHAGRKFARHNLIFIGFLKCNKTCSCFYKSAVEKEKLH